MFDLIKYLQKDFLRTWVKKFRNLLKKKIEVLKENDLNEINFESVFSICDKIGEIEVVKKKISMKMKFLAAVIKIGNSRLQVLALKKVNTLLGLRETIVAWVFENEIISNVLVWENLETFLLLKPALLLATASLDCYQILFVYKFIGSAAIGTAVAEFLLSICVKLQKGVIFTIFSMFSSLSHEEVLFATKFSEKILEFFHFAYQDYNITFFNSLLHSENVTFNNFGIIILSKLYYRFSINPRVTGDVIDHIKNIEKKLWLVQSARLLIELDKLNTNFRAYISEKSAKSAISYMLSEETDTVYTKRVKIEFLLRYLELCVKSVEMINKNMFIDIFNFLNNTENEDIFSEWVTRSIVLFSPDVTEEIFCELFLEKTEYWSWSVYTYKCFMRMFLLLNSFDRCIELKKGEFLMRLQKVLRNMDCLVNVALSGNENVFIECCQILAHLHLKLGEGLNNFRKQIWDDFFDDLLCRSNESNKGRILTILFCFLSPPIENPSCFLLFFLYKTKEENSYKELYIEEHSDIRFLKMRIAENYKREHWSICLYSDNTKYDRFHDDTKVKSLKSNIIIVSFEKDNIELLNFKDFVTHSTAIQEYLKQALEDERDYSQLALKILTETEFNLHIYRDLYQLSKPVNEVLTKKFFSFCFNIRIIEKCINDKVWVQNFFRIGGVSQTLLIFNENFSEDLAFNQSFLFLGLNFVKMYPQYLDSMVVKRVLYAVSVMAFMGVEKDELVSESLIMIKEVDFKLFDNFLQDLEFFQKFWKKVTVLSKNTFISVQVIKVFLELSEKSEKCLNCTIEYLIDIINSPDLHNKYQHELFVFLQKLLTQTKSDIYYLQICKLLSNALKFSKKNLVSGLLFSISVPNFFPSTELLAEVLSCVLNVSKSFGFSKRIRKHFLELLSKLFVNHHRVENSGILENFERFDVGLLKNDWNLSLESINLCSFEYVKLLKSCKNPYLNSVTQMLFYIQEFKLALAMQTNLGLVSNNFQKMFEKFEKYPKTLQNPKKIYSALNDVKKLSLDNMKNICTYTKAVLKALNREHSLKEKKFSMLGDLFIQNKFTKGCDHILSEDTKTFLYLGISVKYKDITEGFNQIFALENKAEECNMCGSLNYIQSQKFISSFPQTLIVLIERFSEIEHSKNVPIFNRAYCEFAQELNLRNYKHEDCKESGKYELIGIISYDMTLNCFLTYCKMSMCWARFRDDSVKVMKKADFFLDLFGIRSENEINFKPNTACVLIFNKFTNLGSITNGCCWDQSNFHRNFRISYEYLLFVKEILPSKSPEVLRFGIKYFFSFAIRLNDYKPLLQLADTLYEQLKSDIRSSEIFLDMLKSENFIDLLLTCEDPLKSQLLIDLITTALNSSRPSAYMRLFTFILSHLENAKTYKSEAYFEVLYTICKLNPTLALDEGANEKIFSQIIFYAEKGKIPSFLLAGFALFYHYIRDVENEAFNDFRFSQLVLEAEHNFLTAFEVGKMIGAVQETTSNFWCFKKMLEYLRGNRFEQFHFVSGVLLVAQKVDTFNKIFGVFKDVLRNGKKTENECFYWSIQAVFYGIVCNKVFLEFMKEQKKYLKEVEKLMGSHKERFLGKFDERFVELGSEIVKAVVNKYKIPVQSMGECFGLKFGMGLMDSCQVVLRINESVYFKVDQKYKFSNLATGKST